MKFVAQALAAVLLVTPVIAVAQTADQTKDDAAVNDESQNRTICKRQKEIGSRLSAKKICMTAAQWDQLERDQREATEKIQAGRWKSN